MRNTQNAAPGIDRDEHRVFWRFDHEHVVVANLLLHRVELREVPSAVSVLEHQLAVDLVRLTCESNLACQQSLHPLDILYFEAGPAGPSDPLIEKPLVIFVSG